MAEDRRYPWRFACFFIAYYAANSVYQGYVTVYFRSVGMSTAQIGMLMSMVPLVSVFSQPLWGALGDRAKSRSRLLRIMAAGAAAAILALTAGSGFAYLMGMICLFSATFIAMQPMGDSVILEDLARRRMPFGPVRLTASVTFALTSLAAGFVMEGRLNLIGPVTAGLLGATFFSTFLLPAAPGMQKKGDQTSMLSIFRIKGMGKLMTLVGLLQVTMGYFYSFFPVYFTELPGGGSGLLGTCYLISALSEIPFLIFCDRLFDRLGAGKLLLSAALAMSARWLILAACPVIPVVMASQVLHGWGFIVLTVAMAKHISQTVPESLRARGQMLLSIVTFGVARVVGNLGGGVVAGALGIGGGFYLMAGLTLAALAAFAPQYLRR